MNREADALARQFEQVARAARAGIASISGAGWGAICPADGWPVGVTACQIADVHRDIVGAIERLAGISQSSSFGRADFDTANAQHAQEHVALGKDAVLRTFSENAAFTAAIIRRLSAEQLDRSREVVPGGPVLSVRDLIRQAAIGHITQHMESIRATLAGQPTIAR